MKQTLLCFLLLCSMSGIAQVRQDFEFVDYLIGNGMKKDAIQYTNRFDTLIPTFPQAQQDSLFFLKGWAYYSSKKLTEAADYFMQMSDSLSPLKPKATYLPPYALLNPDNMLLPIVCFPHSTIPPKYLRLKKQA